MERIARIVGAAVPSTAAAPAARSGRRGLVRALRRCTGACLGALLVAASATCAGAAADLLTVDHRVAHRSTAPANAGERVELHLREKVRADVAAEFDAGGEAAGRVVLFVHGGIVSSVPDFDLPYADYSWMAYLAARGYDVFALDHTGYGRSPRPAMDDPCNLSAADRARIDAALPAEPCTGSYSGPVTTRESDWDEIAAVVEHLRALRGVERVSLVGWSLGGVRAGGYAARHPERVDRLILYSPAYSPTGPGPLRRPTHPVRLRGPEMLTAGRWERAVACADQVDPGIREAVWAAILAEDPLGASWAPPDGVMRLRSSLAEVTGEIGWDAAGAGRIRAPTLVLAGEQDNPQRKRRLYADLTGTDQRVLVIMACATHYALWERTQYRFLHRLSADWLAGESFAGTASGVFRVGVDGSDPRREP